MGVTKAQDYLRALYLESPEEETDNHALFNPFSTGRGEKNGRPY